MAKSRSEIEKNKEFVRHLFARESSALSRECVLPYPREFDRSIDLLVEAARVLVSNKQDVEHARSLILKTADYEMRSWFDEVAQIAGGVRLELLGRTSGLRHGSISIKRPSEKRELEIIQTQGFHCRYCGIRIIPNRQLKRIQQLVGYDIFPNRSRERGKTRNTDIHGVWLMTRATVDHVDPISRGADNVNREENLVASCWSCNYAKWKYTLDELGLDHPDTRSPKFSNWRGLSDYFHD